jgi:hypothetical protein
MAESNQRCELFLRITTLRSAGPNYRKVILGIPKYHFEVEPL